MSMDEQLSRSELERMARLIDSHLLPMHSNSEAVYGCFNKRFFI